jgi:hypothetical protein
MEIHDPVTDTRMARHSDLDSVQTQIQAQTQTHSYTHSDSDSDTHTGRSQTFSRTQYPSNYDSTC